ncbi:MAG: hypothetical protein ACI9CA_002213 [Natronomonas sp.]|jgi:hypothetical protein
MPELHAVTHARTLVAAPGLRDHDDREPVARLPDRDEAVAAAREDR